MRYAVNTLLWTAAFDRSHIDLLPKIAEAGFEGVEIARFAFDGFPARDIRRGVESNGLECIFCSALTGHMSLIDPDTHDAALEYLKTGVRTAAEIGASMFIGPFCSPVGYLPGRRRTADEWNRAVDGLRKLGPVLADAGVTLALEPLNRFETYFLNTAEDARALAIAVADPRVGILFDTFHANIEEKSIPRAIEMLGEYVTHVHACENDRGIPGTGHIAWPGVFDALHRINYDGWVSIESFGFAVPEIAAAACIWRDLAPAPDAIAWEGLKFLKGLKGSGAAA